MKLSALKVDAAAMEAGVWQRAGEEYEDLEFRTRSMNDAYTDAVAARRRRAALQYGGDTTKIPVAVNRSIVAECMLAHVIMDVRGITDDSGAVIAMDRCAELMRDPNYPDILTAAIKAASLVSNIRAADTSDAAGNSPTPSVSA